MGTKNYLIVFVAIFIFSTACCYAENNKIILATGEWPPATSEKLPGYGFITQIVTAACQEAEMIPEYQFLPWKRAEMSVQAGNVLGTFPFMITEERQKECYFSDPLFYGVNCFVYYDKNPKTPKPIPYEELDDLKGYTIGLIRGTSMETELKSAGFKVEATSTLDQSIKKLSRGRIDFYLTEQMVFNDAIKRLYPADVNHYKRLAKPYGAKRPNGIMVSKKFPNAESFLKRFNQALQRIKKNGTYDRIVKPYNLSK